MKLKTVSCTQFAGIRDRSVSFADGLNVIYGKNESGKSTLVNLICRTLFQSAKLDRRRDKEFFSLYFPGEKKGGGVAGDFADGRISFETEKGMYTLSKEWGAEPRCTLSTPEGILRDQKKMEGLLKDALGYGEGVYADLLFSSQRNTDLSLQTILDASRKTDGKQELVNAVSQAFAESDGISTDEIESAIEEKIEEIAGKHWDFERQAPVRKAGRWANGLGEVLKAYYALEDARQSLEELSRLEGEADRTANAYASADIAAQGAEQACARFRSFASRLAVQAEQRKSLQRMDRELQKLEQARTGWPKLNRELERARQLQAEKHNRTVQDAWNLVNRIREEVSQEEIRRAAQPCPDGGEFSVLRMLRRELSALENKLCGMNLNAAVELFDGHGLRITSLRTGEEVKITEGLAAITEAVNISVPGVLEMRLSPADVDVEQIRENIAGTKQRMAQLLEKYSVESLEELERYAQEIESAKMKVERVHSRLAQVLGGMTAETLETLYRQSGPPVRREMAQIQQDIVTLCGQSDAAVFITKAETVLEGYAAEYGTLAMLEAAAAELERERRNVQQALETVQDIPGEYLGIADPEGHLEQLEQERKSLQRLRETALKEKTAAASALEHFQEGLGEDLLGKCQQAQWTFDNCKKLLDHWLHIRQVFRAQKEMLRDNPMQDLADRFGENLRILSGGRVSMEFPEGDKLQMEIYSENNRLDYGKLSEGTKETVSLAFRLAVLDHLFPEGGGVIVLDDPFTDMDGERAEKSCALIQDCARRHQVIFLTCKEEYLEALQGNRIRF